MSMETSDDIRNEQPILGSDIAQIQYMKEHQDNSLFRTALRRLRRDYLTLAAFAVLLVLTLMALGAPLFEQYFEVSYTRTNSGARFLPMGDPTHPLGTDNLGRDMLSRLMYGGRVSLAIGIIAAFFSTFVGVTIGLIAGYYQGGPFGFIDDIIMWFITTLNSIPTLLLLILLTSVLTPTIGTLIAVLTLVSWSGTMRLIRGETISLRENEYIVSALALGARPLRIMFVHILPNTFSILIT